MAGKGGLELGDDPLAIAADAVAAGVSLLNVTLGDRGVAYVARPGFAALADRRPGEHGGGRDGALLHSERLQPPAVDALDPTGCGDVFGATCFARLLAGDSVAMALEASNRAASRAATFRGAGGLARFLRGELVPA